MSIEDQIHKKINDNKHGKIFFPTNFSKIGSIDAIHQALGRLEEKGIILRLEERLPSCKTAIQHLTL
jgi:hypothetical protein